MFKRKGFTLVEVLLVIVIIGILAAIVLPRIIYSKKAAQEQACHANVRALNSQIELYRMNEGDFPAFLNALVPNYIDAVPPCPVDASTQNTYLMNTTTNRIDWEAHKTSAAHN